MRSKANSFAFAILYTESHWVWDQKIGRQIRISVSRVSWYVHLDVLNTSEYERLVADHPTLGGQKYRNKLGVTFALYQLILYKCSFACIKPATHWHRQTVAFFFCDTFLRLVPQYAFHLLVRRPTNAASQQKNAKLLWCQGVARLIINYCTQRISNHLLHVVYFIWCLFQ